MCHRRATATDGLPIERSGKGQAEHHSGFLVRRELLQHPLRPERDAPVRAAADRHVVARARVERKAGLDRIPVVVLLDELVDLVEGPLVRALAPPARERLAVLATGLLERPVRAGDAAAELLALRLDLV